MMMKKKKKWKKKIGFLGFQGESEFGDGMCKEERAHNYYQRI